MSTLLDVASLFPTLPEVLRNELLRCLNEVLRNFREGRWEPSELNGGKLCEVTYTILRGYVDGSYPAAASKPSNFIHACQALEQLSSSAWPRSVRIQIPRMLISLYEIRNNRGVGHVGGDVNPNYMDATAVVYLSKWVVAELVRVLHNVDTKTASSTIEGVVSRILPIIWKIGQNYRVLKPKMSMKEKTLVLLYQHRSPIGETTVFEWVEHSNLAVYRRDVIRPMHKLKLLEYDQGNRTIIISPLGIRYVEESIDLEV